MWTVEQAVVVSNIKKKNENNYTKTKNYKNLWMLLFHHVIQVSGRERHFLVFVINLL